MAPHINLKNSLLIMRKDWKVNLRNKQISIPLFILPIVFGVFIPILMLMGVLYAPNEYLSAFGGKEYLISTLSVNPNYNEYLIAADIAAKIMILPYFLFIPSMITIILSADSFAGEKERKTMESLALLPISKTELILGKVLSAFVPALLLSFTFFLLQGIIINLMFLPYLEGNILIFLDLTWLAMIFLLTPSIAFLNILMGTMVSSRSKDFKSAQSITGSFIVPVLGLLFIQLVNPAFLSPPMILLITAILLGLILIMLRIAKRLLVIEKLILML